MPTPIIIIITIAIAVILIFLFLIPKPKKIAEYKRADFLSTAELKFFRVLDNALGNKYKIFIKPGVADLIKPTAGNNSKLQWSSFGKIKSKHVDFLLCDTNINPVCIIELDDRSHNSNKGIERDIFLNKAFEAAGIPITHFSVKSNYSNIEIEKQIKNLLPDAQKTDIPKCPKCGRHIIKRIAKSGTNAGHDFWGCSNYPSCNGIVNIEA